MVYIAADSHIYERTTSPTDGTQLLRVDFPVFTSAAVYALGMALRSKNSSCTLDAHEIDRRTTSRD
jgi:hypothetical protein